MKILADVLQQWMSQKYTFIILFFPQLYTWISLNWQPNDVKFAENNLRHFWDPIAPEPYGDFHFHLESSFLEIFWGCYSKMRLFY